MTTILSVAAPTGASGGVGMLTLLLILLLVIVGMVVVIRMVMTRMYNRVAASVQREKGNVRPSRVDEAATSGRELKEQYLRGEISRADFDSRLRELQISEYLEDKD